MWGVFLMLWPITTFVTQPEPCLNRLWLLEHCVLVLRLFYFLCTCNKSRNFLMWYPQYSTELRTTATSIECRTQGNWFRQYHHLCTVYCMRICVRYLKILQLDKVSLCIMSGPTSQTKWLVFLYHQLNLVTRFRQETLPTRDIVYFSTFTLFPCP